MKFGMFFKQTNIFLKCQNKAKFDANKGKKEFKKCTFQSNNDYKIKNYAMLTIITINQEQFSLFT